MSEPVVTPSALVPSTGTVHWIGTGLSTGSGVRLLCDRADRVILYGRTVEKAGQCLARLGLAGRAEARAYDASSISGQVGPGDVVVSMLPATEHGALLRICLDRRAHFACSSYVSEEMLALAPAGAGVGIALLAEVGLDPGLDHVLAHALVARARSAVGDGAASAWFTSYCGGVPAVPNEFRYRFSWAPRGVLMALRSPARYVDEGTERVAEYPWEATRSIELAGEEFEVYPNRDSLPFVAQYGLPAGWRLETFVRGTLRLSGWRAAWEPVFTQLRTGDSDRINALAVDLAARYPTTDADRDRVVLAVALTVRGAGGREWSGRYLLDLTGDERENAMARCVSLPMAYGIAGILAGRVPAGLGRAGEAGDAERWILFLHGHGIHCAFTS